MHPRTSPLVRLVLLTLVAGLLLVPGAGSAAPPTSAPAGRGTETPSGRLVSEVPAPRTPHVLNGQVYSVTQVGRTIVLGGSFTKVREHGKRTQLVRRGLVAFDAVTGRISRRFAPKPRGVVRVVLSAGDGRTVYVGGEFTAVGRKKRAKLARIRVADGSLVGSFKPGQITGDVKDLAVARGRLWIAGAFTHVGGHPQQALATLNARTGKHVRFLGLRFRGNHNRGVTQVLKIAMTRNGSRLVAVGNFATVSGAKRHQLAVLHTGGRRATLGRFATKFYTSPCVRKFDATMRDVDLSPDGRWFVVSTTGGYGGPTTSCDTVARFELGATGRNVAPSWVDHTGGDTSYAVEATPAAVYVGGHQRWWNNPFGKNRPGPGAVGRPGIAALDPRNGLPLTWNPGRDLGVGVFDFLLTGAGLWAASDTTRIGGQVKGRIARFPTGGTALPAVRAARLPGDVYLGGPLRKGPDGTPLGVLQQREFTGTTAGPTTGAPDGGLDWRTVRGAFMIGARLYVAHSDGRLTVRPFDGTAYDAATTVSTSDQLVRLGAWADDVRSATGMFFDDGRIYFTRSGSPRLFYRYFSPQSGVVGARRLVAPTSGLDLRSVRGMFVAGGRLYWATPEGTLRSTAWRRGAASGSARGPLGPTWSGAWDARALFVFQG